MNQTVTVSVKGLLVAVLVLLAVVVAYLLGGAGGTTVLPAQAAPQVQPAGAGERPVVRMIGEGTTAVVPDELSFALSVTRKEPDLDAALDGSSATLDRVLDRLVGLGVRRADVQTTGLQMYPEYDYPAYGPPVLTGYRVTQRARVTVRDLADGGRVVSAAVETGGNGVRATDLRLGVSDPEAALARARADAVEQATEKAQQYATAAGRDLGEVLSVQELGGHRAAVRDLRAGASLAREAYDAGKAIPIRAGKDDLAVKVEVQWAFAE
ncbi:SIMPL domain-containing protein [Nocardioides aestuarii]|uniref:SIMPL domain-containing protein n=1 Tax=Nocardioides aestuarii TaxID=252231 RepID=A0ABW4TJZ3_9ACTN